MNKNNIKAGDVIWIKLRGDGYIQNGTSPAVVVQDDKGSSLSSIVKVIPLAGKSTKAKLLTHIMIPANATGLSEDSIAQCEGMRPIEKRDILGAIGKLPDRYMAEISIASLINTPITKYLSIDKMDIIQVN